MPLHIPIHVYALYYSNRFVILQLIPTSSACIHLYMSLYIQILLLISGLGSFSGAAIVVDAAVPASYSNQRHVDTMCQPCGVAALHHLTHEIVDKLFHLTFSVILCIKKGHAYMHCACTMVVKSDQSGHTIAGCYMYM